MDDFKWISDIPILRVPCVIFLRRDKGVTTQYNGVAMISRVIPEMNTNGDYDTYPIVSYTQTTTGDLFTVSTTSRRLGTEYSIHEFMLRSGVHSKPQGNSKLEFVFR